MNKLLISTFIVFIMISVSTTLASGVEVSLSKEMVVLYTEKPTKTVDLDVIVKNTQSRTDTFTLFIPIPSFEKIKADLESGGFIFSLAPNEEKTVKMFISAPIDTDLISTPFNVIAKSTSDETISDGKTVIVTIQRKTPVYITSLTLGKNTFNPSERVEISAKVFNLEETLSDKYLLRITIMKGTTDLKSFDESIDSIGAKSSVNIVETFDVGKYDKPGSYVVKAELKDISDQIKDVESINFIVNTITQPPTEYTKKSSGYNVLFSYVTIKVKNEGNVELPAFTVTESIPKFAQALFDPDVEPVTTDSSGTRVVYTWSVPALSPGGQYTVGYKIAIWRIWLTFAVVGGIGYGAYRWLSKPRINKSVRHEGEITRGKEIVVLLEVKNRALHEIKDVEIIDIVPQIARVVDRFDTLRPKAKRVVDGTELRWNIGAMKSGEERVVTYRIKSVVDIVGHLALPEAQMVFLDRHKVKRMSVSKQALAKAQ